ncbi:MAG: flagellar basal body rod protein FlgF [Chromatiales bacterium]|jgi:flagellar basal-body rod protein FlgF
MDRMLYIAMSGAKETMLAQGVNAHNLANINTTAFKADLAAFTNMQVRGPGFDSRAYAIEQGRGTDLSIGNQISTGRDLDIAVQGEGWIAIQAPDGSEAYTRAGDLHIDSLGRVTVGAGLPVLGDSGPIALPPLQRADIGSDGTVSVVTQGSNPDTVSVIDRIRLVNPPQESLFKDADGFIRKRDGLPAIPDASVQISTGMLESSNVNAVNALVSMIELSRQFEMQVKMMKTAEANDESSAQLLRMG